MPWQVSIFLNILLSSSRAIQNRRIGLHKIDVSAYALAASFVCVFLTGLIYSLISWSSVDNNAALNAWPYLVFGGTLFACINLMVLKLYRYVLASVAIFMSIINTLSVVIFAYFFSSETLGSKQLIGIGFLATAIILIGYVSKKNSKGKSKNLIISVLLVLGTALLFGPAIVNEKYLIDRIGLETYVLYGWGLQAIVSIILALVVTKGNIKLNKYTPKMHIDVWIYAVLLGFSGLFFVLSLRNSGSASLVAASSTAVVAVTIMLAYFILNERSYLFAKLVGLTLSFIGLFLLFT